MMTNKAIALQFLDLVTKGHIDEAYERYVDMEGKHHNTFYPAGFPVLQKGMEENHLQFPNKQFTVKHALADGDMVVSHSHLAFNEGEAGMVVVHIFRFVNGKIVELWDCGQAIPSEMPNTDGVF